MFQTKNIDIMGDKPDPDAAGKVMEGGKRQAESDLSATDRETRKKTKVEYNDTKAGVKEGDGSDDASLSFPDLLHDLLEQRQLPLDMTRKMCDLVFYCGHLVTLSLLILAPRSRFHRVPPPWHIVTSQ